VRCGQRRIRHIRQRVSCRLCVRRDQCIHDRHGKVSEIRCCRESRDTADRHAEPHEHDGLDSIPPQHRIKDRAIECIGSVLAQHQVLRVRLYYVDHLPPGRPFDRIQHGPRLVSAKRIATYGIREGAAIGVFGKTHIDDAHALFTRRRQYPLNRHKQPFDLRRLVPVGDVAHHLTHDHDGVLRVDDLFPSVRNGASLMFHKNRALLDALRLCRY
jgi:hypothetical protein